MTIPLHRYCASYDKHKTLYLCYFDGKYSITPGNEELEITLSFSYFLIFDKI